MQIKKLILKIVRSFLNIIGYDILKYRTTYPSEIVNNLLKRYKISLILDVGANTGQYSKELRKAGFTGRITSFEPLKDAYNSLKAVADKDRNWNAYQYALGDESGKAILHVSKHSPSSSLLPMTDLHTEAAPGSEYYREEEIEIRTLDEMFNSLGVSGERIFMKIDCQGYEDKVLNGAQLSLASIIGLQIELSSTALYHGEGAYYSICEFVEENHFQLVRIIPGFSSKTTGEMLQFDAIFFRKNLV